MAISCGACGKLMKYNQATISCSGTGCSAIAHYACVINPRQEWRCIACSYPSDNSVQYLLGEILKKGSGLELLQGLIGKINDLLTDINAIRDENECLKQEISLLTNNTSISNVNIINQDILMNGSLMQSFSVVAAPSTLSTNKRKFNHLPSKFSKPHQQQQQYPITTFDLTSNNDEQLQAVQSAAALSSATISPSTSSSNIDTLNNSSSNLLQQPPTSSSENSSTISISSTTYHQLPCETPKKISIFVTCSNSTAQNETYLKQYLENTTQVKSLECVRVSCYDTYSMFQIKINEDEAHLVNNPEVYPEGCKLGI